MTSPTEPPRVKLPDTRDSITHHFQVGEVDGYLNVGFYEDGTPGEIFITISKEGSTIGGLTDTIARLTSIAMQYGIPLEKICDKLALMKFEPSGHTISKDITYAHSIVDYIFRWLKLKYPSNYGSNRTDLTD